jgi:hypothetical protein
MSERQPKRPPIPEPQHTPQEGGNGTLGLPQTVHESANPPPYGAVKKTPLTPEERAEKKRKYMRDYRKNNKDKVNEQQRRYRSPDYSERTNEKLIEYQRRRYWERVAKEEEESANDPSTDFAQIEQRLREALQLFPSPRQKK